MTYEVGDRVAYICFDGSQRIVQVTNKQANIKNGRPGFDGRRIDNDEAVWGYDDQIIATSAQPDGV